MRNNLNTRNILTFLLLSIFSAPLFAQTGTQEFTVEGIKVILKNTPKEVISVRMMIEGGTANYSEDKQGIENVTTNLMIDGGTKNRSKLDFKTAAEKIGTSFGASTNLDYGDVNMTCIKLFWDDSWKLFSDAIMQPAFTENEFNILKEQLIANAKATESDPDGYLAVLSRKNAFPGSNYVKDPSGTAKSLETITLSDVKQYYQNTIVKKRVFIVVVGNVTKEDITKKITESMKTMPQGTTAREEEQTILREGKTFIEDRDIATNYIRGVMSSPFANTKDGVSMRIAMSILGDRYFTELRTKRSLSYAPAAFYAGAAVNNPYSVIYISTIDPKQSMQVMVDEINKIKGEGFLEDELVDTREGFLTQYYLTIETTGNQADALGAAEVQGGWEQLDGITAAVNATTLKDINKVFDEYSKAIVWTYLGKQGMVKEEDFKQPVVKKNKPY
ncbi:MAG: insulinase family protein [Fimbriimonadaceae bacterium]|nr:insulinase family protein [Chitinophagales bacterium]